MKAGRKRAFDKNEVTDKAPFQEAMGPVYEAYLTANPDLRPLVELIQATE